MKSNPYFEPIKPHGTEFQIGQQLSRTSSHILRSSFFLTCCTTAQALAEKAALFPEHWSAAPKGGSASALLLVHVQDGGVLKALQACLEGTDIGRTRLHTFFDGPYEKLVLKEAWRVENKGLWKSYEGAQDRVMGLPDWTKEYMGQQIRPELCRSSGKLPGKLLQSCNEVRRR